ncbi:hypothetical protein, partial [Rhodosalinus sp.]|uniref:hypothetical protein n=1 Tax=Rhodosalinus sp. TaxID=2047741 RepID=UPI003564E19A
SMAPNGNPATVDTTRRRGLEGANVNRVYATAGDRAANAAAGEDPRQGRQRSGSTHYRYRSGSIVREHWHNNIHGGQQFSRPIGGIDRDGNPWGEQPTNGFTV